MEKVGKWFRERYAKKIQLGGLGILLYFYVESLSLANCIDQSLQSSRVPSRNLLYIRHGPDIDVSSANDIVDRSEQHDTSVDGTRPIHCRLRWVRQRREEREDKYDSAEKNGCDVDGKPESSEAELGRHQGEAANSTPREGAD